MIPALVNVTLVPPALALVLTAATIWLLLRARIGVHLLDHPNARSLHAEPTPRLGGIGMVAGAGTAWWYLGADLAAGIYIGIATLIAISLLEDFRDVPVLLRLALHLLAGLLAAAALLRPGDGAWLVVVLGLAIAWMINLYNFMDGSNGLAGGMAAIGFGSYGASALLAGDFSFAAINLSIAAAACGFLPFNFPRARVFMGDVGSIPLGYLAAVLGTAGWLRGDWAPWFGVVVFSPFIVDASVTLLKRLARRARVWRAHKEHYYQRLVQSGWGHRKTALAEYTLMLGCGGAAIAGTRLDTSHQLLLLGALSLVYAGVIYALEHNLPQPA